MISQQLPVIASFLRQVVVLFGFITGSQSGRVVIELLGVIVTTLGEALVG
jgi:hypothetical protein